MSRMGFPSLAMLVMACALTANAQTTLVQYTPNLANWTTFYTKVAAVTSVTDHTPNGIGWIPASAWVPWNGTTFNPSTMTASAFHRAICPTGDTIRGLKELFYSQTPAPFANVKAPTKAEVDLWTTKLINHVRRMVNLTGPAWQVSPDICLFARSLWSHQRKWTTMWNVKYPTGTCVGSTDPHCGATFVPNAADQVPYLPAGFPACTALAGAEGITSAPKSNIPWSIKWVRAFCSFLGSEGFWGGHVGPFFFREKFGVSYWDTAVTNTNSNAEFRGKWGGALRTNPYVKPV